MKKLLFTGFALIAFQGLISAEDGTEGINSFSFKKDFNKFRLVLKSKIDELSEKIKENVKEINTKFSFIPKNFDGYNPYAIEEGLGFDTSDNNSENIEKVTDDVKVEKEISDKNVEVVVDSEKTKNVEIVVVDEKLKNDSENKATIEKEISDKEKEYKKLFTENILQHKLQGAAMFTGVVLSAFVYYHYNYFFGDNKSTADKTVELPEETK